MECARWSSASALRTEALSLELIASASRRPDVLEQGAPSWLPRALECVADQCGRDMSVADIAREAQVHPTHLARVFRAFLGCTPGDYLRARRLERAGSLLLDTSLPIARIALDCGFADQPQLTRAFTRTFGMPPDAFRRRKATTAMLHFDKTMSAYRATLGR
jgi:AraC family transcriptional regulator